MQDFLLLMLEKFKQSVDKGNEFGALLTDLLKAFDCIDHKLLIAKIFLTFVIYFDIFLSFKLNSTC